MKKRRTYIKDLREAIRARIWSQLQEALGLKSCSSGSAVSVPTGAELSSRLPAVRVVSGPYKGEKDRARKTHVGTYAFEAHYFRALADGEDVEDGTLEAAEALASLFLDDPDYGLPGFAQPGCCLRACYTESVEIEDSGDLQQPDGLVGHGIVTITVEADSFPYEA